MKKALKLKGIGWDVVSSDGSVDGAVQIQRIDCPDDGRAPAFSGDDDAIQYVISKARRGDDEAVNALWEVLDHDVLVNRLLWEEV
jgi:hypothetical protein